MLRCLTYALNCFLVYLLYTIGAMGEPRLLDRLIFEINGKSFSQRQIEVYHALRTIAAGEASSKALPGPENWTLAVERFKNEMLVYASIEGDTQRMSSFQPDNRQVQLAEKEVQKMQLEDRKFQEFMKKSGLSDDEIIKNFLIIFRVQAYLHSRVQLAASGRSAGLQLLDIDTKSEWFGSLLKLSPFRFYAGGKDYVALQTIRG